mgnify:CR=1 FL=1
MSFNIKTYLQDKLDLTENQVNLLILSSVTTIFQGIIYNFIDHKSFSRKYFLLTILMSMIYNLFYYKMYVNADTKNSKKKKNKQNKNDEDIKNDDIDNDSDYLTEMKDKYEN